jgi:hypothetical protein
MAKQLADVSAKDTEAKEVGRLQAMWKRFDDDGSGRLSAPEIRAVLRAVGQDVSDKRFAKVSACVCMWAERSPHDLVVLAKAMADMDKDGSGEVGSRPRAAAP